MANLKQAYNDFMQALMEETGLSPDLSIRFHSCREVNSVGQYPPVAAGIVYHVAIQLGLSTPVYNESEGYEWFRSEDATRQTDLVLYM